MNSSPSVSLARILAAPWHQRRNAGSLWSLALVLAMCCIGPIILMVLSLFASSPQVEAMQRAFAARAAWIGIFALLVVAWVMLAGNVLQQNHPTLARLAPHHPGQLRTALLVAWAMVSLAAAAIPGSALGAPLAWACGAAGTLALFAAGLRWPRLWLAGIAAPFVVDPLTRMFDAASLGEAIAARWAPHSLLWTAIVVTGGALILVTVIGNGSARHRASYESRQRLNMSFRSGLNCESAAGTSPIASWLGQLARNRRLYHWWMNRLLARADSSVLSRLLAGLGPATHWTSRLNEGFWFLVIGSGVCLLMVNIFGGTLRSGILPWISYSALIGASTNALQAVPRLQQTQREQALLVLLPGVPRGPRLNRWLACEMSRVFLVASAGGMALAWALSTWADALEPGVVDRVNGGMTAGIAAALLPQVAWQWRRWSGLRAAGMGSQTVPVLGTVLMGIAIDALHSITHVGFLTVGITLAIAALAWCAWRWHRMASEPTALPVGRLA